MMDFILNRIDSEDLTTASAISPLPQSVQPALQFIDKLRAQLLEVSLADSEQTRAA
jgi:hypothetical protein